jgi:hypothetical protein
MTHEDFIASRARSAFAKGEPFVIDAAGWEGRYIQGGLNSDTQLYLEAADLDLQGTGTLDESQVSALTVLGFERSESNFSQRLPVTSLDQAASLAGDIGRKSSRSMVRARVRFATPTSTPRIGLRSATFEERRTRPTSRRHNSAGGGTGLRSSPSGCRLSFPTGATTQDSSGTRRARNTRTSSWLMTQRRRNFRAR